MPRPIDLEDPFENDPLLAFQKRGPLPKLAAVRVIALADRVSAEKVFSSAEGLRKLLVERKRPVELLAATIDQEGRAATLERCLEGAQEPIVIVTTATESWSAAQLDAMLDAIDRCDHVVGARKAGILSRGLRGLTSLVWRIVFACPWRDVHSPCRVHRREKLAEIPCQSSSAFLDVEIAAKATFLGHLLDEVVISTIAGIPSRLSFADMSRVFQDPILRRPESTPLEPLERQQESSDSPSGQDRQSDQNDLIKQSGPFEQDGSKTIE